jgi:pimeloyl-ACP methyl ester carboxylesterase
VVIHVLALVLWAVAIAAAIGLHTFFWTRVFRLRRSGDEVHVVTTEDGWKLALHRFLPKHRRFQEPIFLCHGMGANRYNFDLVSDRSLARHLAERGFDVWAVELRGAGQSSRPGWFTPYRWGFDFDDHLRRDIPAALAHVRGQSGGGPVFWVGHSMGGMLGYAWLGLREHHGLRGLVTVSSPVLLRAAPHLRALRPLIWLLSLGRVLVFRPLARFASPFFGWGLHLLSWLVVTPRGLEGALLRRAMVNLVENTSGALMRQFLRWVRAGSFCSRDGRIDYLANLGRIEEPVLILAAERDRIAPPETVVPAYERILSEDKQLRVIGTDHGDDYDFGHGDILLGSMAPAVVYPEIAAWLKSRATHL